MAVCSQFTRLSAKIRLSSLSLFIHYKAEGHPACWCTLSQTHSIESIIIWLLPYTLSHFLAVISGEAKTCIYIRVYENTWLPFLKVFSEISLTHAHTHSNSLSFHIYIMQAIAKPFLEFPECFERSALFLKSHSI